MDAYISGQGRGQNHIVQSGDRDLDFIITGARLRSEGAVQKEEREQSNDEEQAMFDGYKARFSSKLPGFAGITLNQHTMRVQYISYEGADDDDDKDEDETVREKYMYESSPLKWKPLYTFIRHHNHN